MTNDSSDQNKRKSIPDDELAPQPANDSLRRKDKQSITDPIGTDKDIDDLLYGRNTVKRVIATLELDAVTAVQVPAPTPPKSGKVVRAKNNVTPTPSETERAITQEAPWTLQQFFDGEIDLDVELGKRFPAMPMMSRIKFRTLGTRSGRRVATLSTQDESASLIVDADTDSKIIQLSFSLASMLTLRFTLDTLSDMDRDRWLDLMRREHGGLAFLWGPGRWANDYLICISRQYQTNIYAFSPNNFDAGIRMTPAITQQLLDWLETIWDEQPEEDETPPDLLTW